MKRFLALLLSVPMAAQVTVSFAPGATKEPITLVAAQGSPVEIPAAPNHHSRRVQGFSITFTVWMKPTEKPIEMQPTKILFGKIRPTKGRNTLLVRLTKDGDYFKVAFKEGMSGFSVKDDFMPYPGKTAPDPVKQADGVWSIELKEPLQPGDYALVSDLENWQFTVPAAKLTVPA